MLEITSVLLAAEEAVLAFPEGLFLAEDFEAGDAFLIALDLSLTNKRDWLLVCFLPFSYFFEESLDEFGFPLLLFIGVTFELPRTLFAAYVLRAGSCLFTLPDFEEDLLAIYLSDGVFFETLPPLLFEGGGVLLFLF